MKILFAFLLGIKEFKSSYTTNYSDYQKQRAYDSGRELAHKVTFRYWEQN